MVLVFVVGGITYKILDGIRPADSTSIINPLITEEEKLKRDFKNAILKSNTITVTQHVERNIDASLSYLVGHNPPAITVVVGEHLSGRTRALDKAIQDKPYVLKVNMQASSYESFVVAFCSAANTRTSLRKQIYSWLLLTMKPSKACCHALWKRAKNYEKRGFYQHWS